MTSYRVGVDCGGTSAVAVVVDAQGRELSRGHAPGAVATITSVVPSVEAVERATRAALSAAGLEPPVDALWAGLAGAGREAVRAAAESDLATRGLARVVGVGTDIEAAFESAFGPGPGILLIAGTGSVAVARGTDGPIHRTGGWGAHLGDEGGGYWIGMHARGAAARAADGRAQPTVLTARLPQRLGLADARGLIDWVEQATKGEIAALAPTVLEAAEGGDPVAASIVTDAAAALRSHVIALVDRVAPVDALPPLALWGGLIRPGGPLRPALDRLLEPLGSEILATPIDPPLGAARRAARLSETA